MKRTLLSLFILFSTSSLLAQHVKRIVVKGKINVKENNVEGVAVYNTSSNKGTITNAKGEFWISVTLNDVIEFSALQYRNYALIINQVIITSQIMNVFLVEEINALNEVILLPSGLTGNIKVDIKKVVEPIPITMNFGDLSGIEFPIDHLTKVDNELMKKGQLYNGVNFASLLGLNKLLFERKKKGLPLNFESEPEIELTDIFSPNYINLNFNIPLDEVEKFVTFVTSNCLDRGLFKEEKKMELIEFLVAQSRLYLKASDGED